MVCPHHTPSSSCLQPPAHPTSELTAHPPHCVIITPPPTPPPTRPPTPPDRPPHPTAHPTRPPTPPDRPPHPAARYGPAGARDWTRRSTRPAPAGTSPPRGPSTSQTECDLTETSGGSDRECVWKRDVIALSCSVYLHSVCSHTRSLYVSLQPWNRTTF